MRRSRIALGCSRTDEKNFEWMLIVQKAEGGLGIRLVLSPPSKVHPAYYLLFLFFVVFGVFGVADMFPVDAVPL